MTDTYEDTLMGSGYIAGWPGMWPSGSRVIRNQWGDVINVLPPDANDDTSLQVTEPVVQAAVESEAESEVSA